MPRRLRNSILGVILLSLGLGFTACNDEKPAPEEPVAGQQEDPATPPPMNDKAPFSPETVYFAFDSFELSSSAQAKLNALADYLNQNSGASVQIEGHCDERGTVQYNLALGENRAVSVSKFLKNLGVSEERITTISYGEERPVNSEHNEAAWSQNRRAEFIISN